ncbi:hypothetical protein L3073_02910 [Ancylomarina sp. DW003]|nr:hypothetical protein [Ancylomarina sp. DW003]MDE5421153.1 hypothetical protein [Ancylomarina sp. DW003]
MFKKITITCVLVLYSMLLWSQSEGVSIGKGRVAAHDKSILELVSDSKGLLIPRLTTTEREAMFAAEDQSANGLMVYDNQESKFYFWDGSSWNNMGSGEQSLNYGTVLPDVADYSKGDLFFNETNEFLYVHKDTEWLAINNSGASVSITDNLASSSTTEALSANQGMVLKALVDINTSKVGVSPAQATIISNTSGTNTGDQDISGIATNATSIANIESDQTTQDVAIALNTAKTGITTTQANAIADNTTDIATKVDKETGKGLSANDYTDAEKTKLAGAELTANKNAANGYAGLDNNTKIDLAQLPAITINNVYTVADEGAQLALSASQGDVAIRIDISKNYIQNGGSAGDLSDWSELASPSVDVSSVNGKTGNVVIGITDIATLQSNLGSKANTADLATVATSGSFDDLSGRPVNLDTDSTDDLLKTDLVNDLTTGGDSKSLTAEQGKNLKALVDVNTAKTGITTAQANAITANTTALDTKLAKNLADANIFVGNSSNEAAGIALSGDATLANTGVLTIANNAISTTKISNDAVTVDKLAHGTADGQVMRWDATAETWQLVDLGSVTVTENDGIIGNEITNASNGTLTRSGAGTTSDPYTLGVSTGGINTAELADNAVTTAKLTDGVVTPTKLNGISTNGTSGQVLATNADGSFSYADATVVEDVLSSTSTSNALSAAQGKILKDLVDVNTAKTGITTEQTDAIVANTAKVGVTPAQATIIGNTSGVNTGDQDISGIATNATAIADLESEQTTQDAAIALNTAKTGITTEQADAIVANTAKVGVTPAQATIIGNTSGVNTGDQDISGIATNTTAISNLESEQTIQDAAIALNTAKTGITTEQADAIVANTAKVGVTPAQATIIGNTSGVNTGDQDISGIATNTTAIANLESEQTTQDAAIALNTAKVGVTPAQATIIGNTSGVNTGDQDISGIAANTTALDAKVDKVTGKGLSTNDYTDAEKSKLAGLANTTVVNDLTTGGTTDALSAEQGKTLEDAKLAKTLADGSLFVGNATNEATAVTLSGDATLANDGTLTIEDDAVDGSDISLTNEAAGDVMYHDSTDWVRLPKGSAGQVLAINDAGTAPIWKTMASSGSDGKRIGEFVYAKSGRTEADGYLAVNPGTIVNGATTYPLWAAQYPEFVSGNDIVFPADVEGMFLRNVGGNAGTEGVFQTDQTAANGLVYGKTTFSVQLSSGIYQAIGNASSSGAGIVNLNATSEDPETAPVNRAYQLYTIVDTY